jgi:hypothetical protein
MSRRARGEAAYGWSGLSGTRDVTVPLPRNEQGTIRDYAFSPEDIEALDRFAGLEASGVPVILTEFPVPEAALAVFTDPERDYQLFVDTITDYATANHLTFILRPAPDVLPKDGWVDYIHVNKSGAVAYSTWLGHQIGQEVNDDRLHLDPPLTGSQQP